MQRTTWRTLGVLGLVAVLATSVPAAFVSAHAEYERSTPARDEVVAEAPARVDVFFKQDVFKQAGKNHARVFDDGETQVSEGDGTVDDDNRRHIFADLPPGLPNGRYIVRWMTTSDEDGDTDEGAFCFYVGVEPTVDQQAECAALADEENPTATASLSTPTANQVEPTATTAPAPNDASDDGGVPTVALVIGAIAGAAVVVVVGGAVAVWLRRAIG